MDLGTKLLRLSGAILTATAVALFLHIAIVAPSDFSANFLWLTVGLFVVAGVPFVLARAELSNFDRRRAGVAFIGVAVVALLLLVVVIR